MTDFAYDYPSSWCQFESVISKFACFREFPDSKLQHVLLDGRMKPYDCINTFQYSTLFIHHLLYVLVVLIMSQMIKPNHSSTCCSVLSLL